jgi:hypothetical protein
MYFQTKQNKIGTKYTETFVDWTPLCLVQSVQSKKVFILRVTIKIDVLLGFVKEPIDCHSLGRLHLILSWLVILFWFYCIFV